MVLSFWPRRTISFFVAGFSIGRAGRLCSLSLLRTHIHAVRNIIDKPFGRPMLLNVPGVGYRLVDPDEP